MWSHASCHIAHLICRQVLQEVFLLFGLGDVDTAGGQHVGARGGVPRPHLQKRGQSFAVRNGKHEFRSRTGTQTWH